MEESERSFGVGAEEKEKEEEDREQMAVAPVSSAQQTGAARWREHSQESAAFWGNRRRLASSFGFNNRLKKKGRVNQSEGHADAILRIVYGCVCTGAHVLTHASEVTSSRGEDK